MDSVDMKLLKLLVDDAQVPLRELGREVGLSTSGVRRRIKRLVRHGLIKKYSVVIDPQKFGYGVVAFVSIDADSRSSRELIHSLKRSHQVCGLYRTTGGHGLMMKVHAKDMNNLNKFIDENIRPFGSVTRIRTTVAMEILKETLLGP